MITKTDFPQSLKVDLEVSYNEGLKARTDLTWKEIVRIETTTSSAKRMVFYGEKARLRRFRDERQPQTFYEYTMTATLDTWEYTETVNRAVLDDDQSGGTLRRTIGEFGRNVAISLERETWEYFHKGVSEICFDGTVLIGSVHVYTDTNGATHGTAWSNVQTGGSQLDSTTLQLTQQHFSTLLDDRNNVFGSRLTHVGVKRGSLNAKSARELSNSQFTVEVSTAKGQMTENVFKGSFGILETDYGIGASEWAGLDLSDPSRRPLIVLSHSVSPGINNLEYTQLLEDSETGFWRNEFAFGVQGRFDWNPGDPRTVYLHGASDYTFTPADYENTRELPSNI